MSEDRIRLSIEGAIARITFCAPERRNAVDLAFLEEFSQAALDVATMPVARAILMDAEGPAFSVGGDLEEMRRERDRAERHVLEMASLFHLGLERLRAAPAPVIAAVQGAAAGGGFSIAIGADLTIAAKSARFVSAYSASGLTPDGGATWFLPRLTGRQKAFEILALNPALSAEEAMAAGLVARVVPDSELAAEALSAAKKIAALPGDAMAVIKRQLHASSTNSLAEQLALEAGGIARAAGTPEVQAALDAFFAARKR
jgi:2-(1,2-epoxy-1,2-dihydrophenyl)acetyl-CoA isomerase